MIYTIVHSLLFCISVYASLTQCKKYFESYLSMIPSETLNYICHKVVSYTLFVGVIIPITQYIYDFKSVYVIHIFGNVFVACASYYYHTVGCIFIAKYKEVNYIHSDIIVPFLTDIAGIHVNSFCSLLTNYFDISMSSPVVFISLNAHIVCYTSNILHVYYTKYNKNELPYNESGNFVLMQYLFVGIPTIYDICMICWNSADSGYSDDGIYVLFIMGYLFYIYPFRDLTHIAFHMCLLIHAYLCAKCNMYVHSTII